MTATFHTTTDLMSWGRVLRERHHVGGLLEHGGACAYRVVGCG